MSLIARGVDDLDRANAFYVRLGFRRSAKGGSKDVSFSVHDNVVPGLFPHTELVKDSGGRDGRAGLGDVALAVNVEREAAVDEALSLATAAATTLLKADENVFWGGYFADTEGLAWELPSTRSFLLIHRV